MLEDDDDEEIRAAALKELENEVEEEGEERGKMWKNLSSSAESYGSSIGINC